MPVTYNPPSGVNDIDGNGDDLTINLDNESGSTGSHVTGAISGSVLALSFDTDGDAAFDDDVLDIQDFDVVTFNADPDGSNVTLSGDLSAAALSSIEFNGSAAADSFNGSGISSTTTLTLAGGGGNDTLRGGAGDDVIDGGAGNDLIIYAYGGGTDVIDGGEGGEASLGDTLAIALNNGVPATPANLTVTASGSTVTLTFDDAATPTVTNVERLLINTEDDGSNITLSGDLAATGITSALLGGGNGADVFNGSGVTSATPFTTMNGNGGNDTLTGSAGADDISGGTGDDVLRGNGGVDTIQGGFETGGLGDIAVYSDELTSADITFSGSLWQVASAADGTETLAEIETVQDASGPDFLLVGGNGFATIQAAVDAASAGDTILIADGTYDEHVLVDAAVIITGASGDAADVHVASFQIDGSILPGAGDRVEISNLTLDSSLSSAADRGIRFDGVFSSASTLLGTVAIDNVVASGYDQNGIFINGGGTDLNVEISDSDLSGNGDNQSSGGAGDILLFEFTGNAAFESVDVSGTTSGAADHGIQLAGYNSSVTAVASNDIGTVTFDDVTVTGDYENTLVFLQGYRDFEGLSFTDTTIGDGSSSAAWTGLYIDPSIGNPSSPAATDGTTDIDLSGITFGGGTFGNFGATPNATSFINGSYSFNDNITGSSGNDVVSSLIGSDTVSLGDGDDRHVSAPFTGDKIIDGGNGSDHVVLLNIDGSLAPSTNRVTHAVTASGTDLVVTMNLTAPVFPAGSVTAANAEELLIRFGAGSGGLGDTVNITGDFSATALETITVEGGTAADIVNASGLTSTHALDLTGGGGNDSLTGGAGNDAIAGGIGNDAINGGGGDDSIVYASGDGSDAINGGEGAETLGDTLTVDLDNGTGTLANLTGTAAGVTLTLDFDGPALTTVTNVEKLIIDGDANGTNVDLSGDLAATGIAASTVIFNGGAGDDVYDGSDVIGVNQEIYGNGGNDSLSGGDGNDLIQGAVGNDTLLGGAGNDVIDGGSDNDVIQVGAALGDGDDAIDGGADSDTYNASTTTAGVIVNLASTATGSEVGTDTLTGIENATGGSGNDSLTGDGGANALSGLAGNDTLSGAGDNDVLFGGLGNDTLEGGAGNDFESGDAGNDSIVAGLGNDTINGGADTDTYDASATTAGVSVTLIFGTANGSEVGSDTLTSIENLTGGSGNDFLHGHLTAANVLSGGGGDDLLSGNAGNDTLFGGPGNDSLLSGPDNDTVNGDAGNDTIAGDPGDDTIDGGADIDTFNASSFSNSVNVNLASTATGAGLGTDTFVGNSVENATTGSGDDTLTGNADANVLTGNFGNDGLNGAGGNDTLFGGLGNDTLDGGADNDVVNGEAGADVIVAGLGDDANDGGADTDVYNASATTAGVTVTLGGAATGAEIGTDTLTGIENATGGSGNDSLTGDGGANVLTGGAGNDSLDGAGDNDTLFGGLGNDTLAGGAGNDIVNGDAGDDTIVAGLGDDTLDGGADSDTYDASATTAGVTVNLGTSSATGAEIGTDTFVGSSVENATGGSGDDSLTGDSGANALAGGAGDDSFSYSYGGGSDAIDGGEGSETLGDTLTVDLDNGGAGASNLTGTAAASTLTLGFDDAASTTVTNVEQLVIDADADGSSVTLSGDLGATGIEPSTVVFNGSGASDVFDGSGVTSATTLELNGLGGDDTLGGGAGEDLIDGGADSDTASYAGFDSTDATITFNTGTQRFEVSIAGVTDEVVNVETLSFDDTDIQLVGGGSELNLQQAINASNPGDTIVLGSGTFDDDFSQIVVDRDINIVGQGQGVTTVEAQFDTGSSGDSRGWFLVNDDVELNVSGVTFDGGGQLIWQAFRHKGSGTFDDAEFKNIKFQSSGSPYAGTAVAAFGTGGEDVDVTNSTFSNIGRIGVQYFGAGVTGTFDGNSYTGKGTGDHLDYAVEVGAGAVVDVTNNQISDNLGVASDNSTSAGVLVTTFFGGGSSATISGNTLTNNTTGIAVGFDGTDSSAVAIGAGNVVTGGDEGMVVVGNGTVTTPENLGGANGTILWDGGPGNNTIGGAALADELSGGAGNDAISGGGGADAIEGGTGNDVIDGGSGDDAIAYASGDGSDAIDGGEGGEVLGDTLTVELDNGTGAGATLSGTAAGSTLTLDFDGPDTTTVTNVENLIINGDADGSNVTMSGDLAATGISPSTVIFNGTGGDDVYDGSGVTGVEQEINGNGGNDTLTGGTGNDLVQGGADNDTLGASGGIDTLDGGTGIDTYDGSAQIGPLDIDLGAGTASGSLLDTGATLGVGYFFPNLATLYSGASYTPASFSIGSGQETDVNVEDVTHLLVDFDADSLSIVFDTILSSPTWGNTAFNGLVFNSDLVNEILTATVDGSTTMSGFVNSNVSFTSDELLLNWAGRPYVDGTLVNINFTFIPDTLIDIENATGGSGDDSITGSSVANVLTGGAGNDSLNGAGDNDTLFGGLGNDTLAGGAGNDIVNGDAGNDTIVADLGDDTIQGGADTDTYDASATTAGVIVNLGTNSATGAEIGTDTLTGIENATGGSGADSLTGDSGANALAGGAGDDSFSYSSGGGSDAIDGGESGETAGDTLTVALDNGVAATPASLSGTASGSTLSLDFDGPDTATVTHVETLVINGDVDGSNVTLSGDLAATGISSSTVVFNGTAGPDSFDGSAVTSATTLDLNGNGGADTLTGGAGADLIDGGAGDDTLRGNGGADTIDGGSEGIGTLGDVAVYSDTPLTGADITFSGSWQVASGTDGTDSLTEIETVRDGNGNNFLLVGGDAFATIQDAVDAASAGDTIVIAAGTYNESVTITKALSFVGDGVGSTIVTPPGANQSGFLINSDLGAGNTVSISGISFDDASQSGIQFTSSAVLGTLAIDDSSFTSNYRNGVEVVNGTGLGNITITDSTFTDNGGRNTGDPVQTSSGDGDIILFQYNGDATLTNLDLTNGGQDLAIAENGIQFRSDTGALGTVVLDDITIAGSYEKVPLAIYNYDDVDGLSATDVVVTADSTSFQLAVNFDGVGGNIDLTTLDIDVSGAPDPVGLQGDGTANIFTGGAENDFLVGNGGGDTLDGGAGNDTFLEYVGDGSDSITGGLGTDTLNVRLDNDFTPPIGQPNADTSNLTGVINGSNELELTWGDTGHVDTVSGVESIVITADADGSTVTMSGDLSLAGVSPSTVIFTGGAGDDVYDGSGVTGVNQELTGNGGNDALSGGGGNDTLFGGIGNDTLAGGAGNDIVNGDGGDDVIVAGLGDDANDGGADTDLYDASATTAGVTVTLGGAATGAEIGTDTLTGIENATGGSGNDSLTGDGGANVLTGGGGNDSLSGAGGNDTVAGGSGNDSLDGGLGNDSLDGGLGNDTLIAGAGDDAIGGGADSDTYDASAATATVTVNLGTTSATGADVGTDTLTSIENATGGSGADAITGDALANVLSGNGGADVISGAGGNDTIFGGSGNDTISDGAGDDDADGEADDDTVNGALDGEDDTYRGGSGTDTIRFATATAAVTIDLTNGMLPFGNASGSEIGSSNRLFAFENMQGGSGNDTLTGNAVANVVFASLGNDAVDGVGGTDTYDSSAAVSGVTINLGAGTYSGIGTGTLASIENAIGGSGADNLIGSAVSNVLTGNAGNDGLSGGDDADTLFGGLGNDVLVGGNGVDTGVYTGASGDYSFVLSTSGTISGGGEGTDSYSEMEYLLFQNNTPDNTLDDELIALVPAPIADDDLGATGPSGNQAISVLANDTESDNSTPLTSVSVTAMSVSSAPSNGLALALADDRILYVGDDGFSGSDGFEYSITTAEGSDSAQVDLVVQAPGLLAESSFINGNNNNEVLVGTASANFMFGSGGNDDLYTLVGEDTADGGSGNDLLVADGGGNQLTGGLGTDLFVLTHESNDVNDFEIITDWTQAQGDQVLIGLEGLTGADGSIEANRVGVLEFSGDTFLLADLDDNGGTGSGGLESVIARLDDVTGVAVADIVANDLWV